MRGGEEERREKGRKERSAEGEVKEGIGERGE